MLRQFAVKLQVSFSLTCVWDGDIVRLDTKGLTLISYEDIYLPWSTTASHGIRDAPSTYLAYGVFVPDLLLFVDDRVVVSNRAEGPTIFNSVSRSHGSQGTVSDYEQQPESILTWTYPRFSAPASRRFRRALSMFAAMRWSVAPAVWMARSTVGG